MIAAAHRLRRRLTTHLAAALLGGLVLTLAIVRFAPGASPTMTTGSQPNAYSQPAASVDSVAITVADLDHSVAFYTDVLGFEQCGSEQELTGAPTEHITGVFGARIRRAELRLGRERITLNQYLAPEGRPIPGDSRSNDRWFQHIAIVVADIGRAYAHLRAHKVRHASTGPQTLPQSIPNAAGISAFYFKDPDGHVLEIIHFPVGKGDLRWQTPGDRLFLGIDHTAIVVANTDTSIAFYQNALGLRVVGTSENFGTEQEHLNNVFGARLRITALRGTSGPGVELLEYLAPGNGRRYPEDSRSNDLWSWETVFTTPDLNGINDRIRSAHAALVSPGVVNGAPDGTALAARDPDGHVVLVQQPAP